MHKAGTRGPIWVEALGGAVVRPEAACPGGTRAGTVLATSSSSQEPVKAGACVGWDASP